MHKSDEIASLFNNYLMNSCSREDYEKTLEILKDPYHHLYLQTTLYKIWNEIEDKNAVELSDDEKKDLNQSLSNIHHEINLLGKDWEATSNFKKITGILVKIAAALLLPVMVVSLWYFFTSRNPYQSTDSFITIDTPNGSKIRTELPDGTIVWQNSGSKVKYPRNFTKRNRQVILIGEAWFDVKTDKFHPFFVTTKDYLIEVTGTRFNVTGYKEDDASCIVLESGHISVKKNQNPNSRAYSLVPGDRLVNSMIKGETISHNVDVKKYVSWIDGKLIFRNDPLEEIFKRLSRWYNVEIVVDDQEGKFKNLPFTMTIEYESLPQILEYLRHAAPLIIKEEKLVLQENGTFSRQKYIIKCRK